MPDYEANVTSRLDAAILMTSAPGVDPDQAKSAIEEAVADYPNVTVNTPADVTRKARQSVDQLLGIVTALLLLAVVVAILGIVNTLALSVVERTHELGLLRAVGSTRRQVRAVIRRESVLMSLLGALTGIALGTACGVALARALVDEGITTVTVPGADPAGLPARGRGGRHPRRARTGATGQQGGRAARADGGVTGSEQLGQAVACRVLAESGLGPKAGRTRDVSQRETSRRTPSPRGAPQPIRSGVQRLHSKRVAISRNVGAGRSLACLLVLRPGVPASYA